MTYRLVIFDFDGTLADSGGWAVGMMNELARRHGFRELSDDEVAMLRGRSNREIVSYMKVPAWKMPAIAADFRRRMGEEAEKIALFEGVAPLLTSLKAAGLKVALVTSNAEDNARRILGAAAADIDDFECGASLFGKAKKFRSVMRRQGVAPGETLCIGDETRDIEAAKAVGAASGAVTWGYATPEVLARFEPTMTFEAPEEIARALG